LVNNIPIANYDTETLRAHTGILLSQQDIFEGSLLENITMGSQLVSLPQINELAEKTGLIPFLTSLNKGYDTVLDATGNRLPRNVVHKILLMRALLNKPQLLLLEEPWTGLQEKNKTLVRELLLNKSNTTVLVVTHDEEFISKCDKIIYMNERGCEVKEGFNNSPGGGEGF
jgi:ABC-type transport system involved in cytochrome bd biosynthesis fused ATPase/permease subunit